MTMMDLDIYELGEQEHHKRARLCGRQLLYCDMMDTFSTVSHVDVEIIRYWRCGVV